MALIERAPAAPRVFLDGGGAEGRPSRTRMPATTGAPCKECPADDANPDMTALRRQTDTQPTRHDVAAWRIARLRASGFGRELAEDIARDRRYDLHALLELVDRGCPAELAVRILSPLEDPGGRWC